MHCRIGSIQKKGSHPAAYLKRPGPGEIMKHIRTAVFTAAAALALTLCPCTESLAADYTIASCWWDDYNGSIIARWDEPEDKTKYKVQLYKGAVYFDDGSVINANKVGNLINANHESHDMTRLIKEMGAGTYRFTVYAVQNPNDILESDPIQITYERLEVSPDLAGWQYINDNWYLYGEDGTMRYGWQMVDGVWYYLSSKGICLLDTYTPDGYYVDATGAWDGQPAVPKVYYATEDDIPDRR